MELESSLKLPQACANKGNQLVCCVLGTEEDCQYCEAKHLGW